MARAEKGAGKGSATKRKERRQAKFNPGPGPQSVKPIGGADAAGFDDANVEAKKKAKSPGKLSKKRKAEGASNDVGDAPAAAAIKSKKSKKLIAQLSSLVNSIQLNREEPSRARNDINNVS